MDENTLIKEIARRLKALRLRKGLRQSELSDQIGLSCRHFQKLEAGEIDFRASTLARLASSLGVCPSRLMAEEDRTPSEALAETLSLAVKAGKIGLWRVDKRKSVRGEYDALKEILGVRLEHDPFYAREWIRGHVEPSARERFNLLLDRFDNGESEKLEFECRVQTPHHGWIWITICVVKEESDKNGRPLVYCGFVQDITRWKATYSFDEPIETIRGCSSLLMRANKGEIELAPQKRVMLLQQLDQALGSITESLKRPR